MSDDRISFRLDAHELRMLDEFLSKHRDFGSRSHLARVAIRKYIEEGESWKENTEEENGRTKTYRVTLSPIEASVIEKLVNLGYYLDADDAIRHLIRNSLVGESNIQKAVDSIHETRRKLVQMDEEK